MRNCEKILKKNQKFKNAKRFWECSGTGNHKKIFQVFVKKIFEINSLKLGATGKIIKKWQKFFQKNQNRKNAECFWEYSGPGILCSN